MTLPKNGKKLTENEEKSMKIALKEAGIRAIHPERITYKQENYHQILQVRTIPLRFHVFFAQT